ncbi:hypothetical protein PR048_015124 [Dryococelus australis]|uniref:Uncharacterized protein n=1 Tax=Dryococelus australis TaxID=614101 RepID=A0ABQ9HGK2_9NEOP|nr:hypothetical protein PR048_015124 [Dryococelus australis]
MLGWFLNPGHGRFLPCFFLSEQLAPFLTTSLSTRCLHGGISLRSGSRDMKVKPIMKDKDRGSSGKKSLLLVCESCDMFHVLVVAGALLGLALPGNNVEEEESAIVSSSCRELEKVEQRTDDHIDRLKARHDRRMSGEILQEGQLAWLYNPHRLKEHLNLQKCWEEGSYRILKNTNVVVFRICRPGSRTEPKAAHIDRLVLYESPDVRDELT